MGSITTTMWVTLDGVAQGLGRADEDTRGGFTHGGWGSRYNDEVMASEMAKSMAKPGEGLQLDGYHLFHAIRGDLLTRLGRAADARQAFQAAARLTQNQREHDYLLARRDALTSLE